MSNSLNDKLKDIYQTYKDYDNPPVPVDKIREYLELSGVNIEDSD